MSETSWHRKFAPIREPNSITYSFYVFVVRAEKLPGLRRARKIESKHIANDVAKAKWGNYGFFSFSSALYTSLKMIFPSWWPIFPHSVHPRILGLSGLRLIRVRWKLEGKKGKAFGRGCLVEVSLSLWWHAWSCCGSLQGRIKDRKKSFLSYSGRDLALWMSDSRSILYIKIQVLPL